MWTRRRCIVSCIVDSLGYECSVRLAIIAVDYGRLPTLCYVIVKNNIIVSVFRARMVSVWYVTYRKVMTGGMLVEFRLYIGPGLLT